mgnify:FL=1
MFARNPTNTPEGLVPSSTNSKPLLNESIYGMKINKTVTKTPFKHFWSINSKKRTYTYQKIHFFVNNEKQFAMKKLTARNIISLILFFMLLLCVLRNTTLVNSAMFQQFSFVFISLGLFFSLVIFSDSKLYITPVILYIVSWIGYISIHSFIKGECEWYQSSYFIISFIYMTALANLIKKKVLNCKQIAIIFGGIGILEACWCILQFIHLLPPANPVFTVSGSFDNPNITAMYLAAIFPFILFNSKKTLILWIGILVILTAILILKCRTAYLGVIVILLYYLAQSPVISYIKKLSKLTKITLTVCVLFTMFIGAFQLYHLKKDSADGRRFIWKVTTQMIAEKPFFGYGYGLFAKNYNLQQAKYFKENKGTVQERQNARHVYNAFNEYLEQTAKGGIIGGAFFVIFLVILIVQSYRYKNKVTLAVLLAIGTMSLTNYVQAALPVWILLLTVAALLASTGKSYSMNSMISKGLYVSVLIPFVFLSLMFNAQRQLKNSIDEHLSSPDRMEQYAVAAGSSEIYHRLYAKALIKAQEYEKALNVLCKAEKYTSSPSLFMLKATCLENLHRTKEAVENIETVYYMIPNDDDAKFELMLLYDALSQTDEMRSICNEILSLNKPESRKVNHYKNIADSLLKRRVP